MPWKSEAQRTKWAQLVNEGRVTQEQFDAREQETGDEALPERATPRKRTVGPSRSAGEARFGDRRY
jgi:hypothetical protein